MNSNGLVHDAGDVRPARIELEVVAGLHRLDGHLLCSRFARREIRAQAGEFVTSGAQPAEQ